MTEGRSERTAWLVGGLLLLVLGALFPSGWQEALPRNLEIPKPAVSGAHLFQGILVVEGLLLLWLSSRGYRYRGLAESSRCRLPPPPASSSTITRAQAGRLLAGITLLALLLRLWRLSADLWVDEFGAIADAQSLSTLAVVGSYLRSNVHLLNTLAMKLSLGLLGESEVAARLPAVLVGSATIPALYRLSRLTLSRGASLGAALLLAISYHHIFFSQNARGYVFYLFFAVVSSTLLIRALADDRARTWAGYIIASLLGFASLLISGFVFAAHAMVAATTLLLLYRRGVSPAPLAGRLLAVFAITAALGFQIYSLMLPEVVAYIGVSYANPSSGYQLLSMEFAREMLRGLSAGLGTGVVLALVPLGLVAAAGFLALLRQHWMLALSLVLPPVLTAALLLVRGLTVSPRFFLLGLPLAIVNGVLAIDIVARCAGRWLAWSGTGERRVATTLIVVVAALSLVLLPSYYATPKQPYRASLAFVKEIRRPGEIAIAIHTARYGCEYYGPKLGLRVGDDLFLVTTVDELESTLAQHGARGAILITSMPRALHLVHPDLEARIAADWETARTFPATIGDGQLSVWRSRGAR